MSCTRRDLLLGAAGLAGAATLPRMARADPLVEIDGDAFGTSWRVLLRAERAMARAVGHDIARLLRSLDAVLSPFRGDSELSRLNGAERTMGLSPPLADVVREGLRIAHLTGGAFDPTVGPAVARFGFGPIREPGFPTGSPDDYRGLVLSGGAVTKRHDELTFDPCGIGKGYALDRIGALLASRGVNVFFAEFGGEVLVRGRHPAARPWRIGIEQPVPGPVRLRHAVALAGGAVATSGDRVNGYVVGGRRYSHVVDPRTDEPVNNGVASVSVIARSATEADALATALMVMGPARGLAFAARTSLPVLFVMHREDELRDVWNAAFRAAMIG